MRESKFALGFGAVATETKGKVSNAGFMCKLSGRAKQAVAILAAVIMSVAAMPSVQVSAADVPSSSMTANQRLTIPTTSSIQTTTPTGEPRRLNYALAAQWRAETFAPPLSVADREGFQVSPERVPHWIIPEQRTLEDLENFVPHDFALAIFEEMNAIQAANNNPLWTWNNILAAHSEWRAGFGDDLMARTPDIFPMDTASPVLTITPRGAVLDIHPDNVTAKAVAEEIHSFAMANFFTETVRNEGMSGDRQGMMGVGIDLERGFIAVSMTVVRWWDVIDRSPPIEMVAGGVLHDSPYFFAFFEEYNPFNPVYMLARGRYENLTNEKIDSQIITDWADKMFYLVNEMRVAHGVPPVQRDNSLERAAIATANAGIRGNHTGFDGSTPTNRARREGWTGGSIAENAVGFNAGGNPLADIAVWMISPNHRANILNPRHTHFGGGIGLQGDLLTFLEESHWSIDRNERTPIGASWAIQQFGRR